MDQHFAINPELNAAGLAPSYATSKRLQIQNFLTEESAQHLYHCLANQVPWGFAYQDDGPKYKRAEELTKMSPADQNVLLQRLYKGAQNGFQYAYNCYPILDAYLQKWGQVPLLDRYLEFLNDQPMLDFIRTLTGRKDITKGDSQATRYGPGQFLKYHTDDVVEEKRVAAFVLNLTPKWDKDWGGYLQFYDKSGDIEQAFLPRFNTLNIFTVPQDHSVSYVANYATGQRYALTGWFRYG
ncbi:2OG-Fe(II) oxygenase [Kordiimonas sediminis]|uniref:2OG-Fe(II) oxygenase n=1 Tax=Kordiimonas sediminis TaxID=1735581 RepID=A0A919AIJ1_9PROT|nr:2OG-Fe(II) oxygenase family protein [Kordiimonas sediminis]GHF10380.1 2OG-Fe(II) oxygenase [Kordiimonas sediminis]